MGKAMFPRPKGKNGIRWRHFIYGITRINPFPLSVPVRPLSPKEAAKADAEALASDFKAVGDDIRTAMEKFEEEQKKKK